MKPLHNPGPSTGSAGTTGVSDNRPEKSWSWLCPRSPSAAASIQLPPACACGCGSGSLSTFGKRQFKKNTHSSYSVLAFPSIVFLLTWQPSGLASSPLLFSFFFFFFFKESFRVSPAIFRKVNLFYFIRRKVLPAYMGTYARLGPTEAR